MTIHAFPANPVALARRRASQNQQQPARFWLNRQQQQQGYSEYQRGQNAPALEGGTPARAHLEDHSHHHFTERQQ